jgi:hypothetical protein
MKIKGMTGLIVPISPLKQPLATGTSSGTTLPTRAIMGFGWVSLKKINFQKT